MKKVSAALAAIAVVVAVAVGLLLASASPATAQLDILDGLGGLLEGLPIVGDVADNIWS